MGISVFSGSSSYTLDVDAYVVSQNQAAWYSTIYWRINVVKTSGLGYWASVGNGNTGWADSSVGSNPDLWNNTNLAYDFRNGAETGTFLIADGQFDIGHNPDGTASYFVNGHLDLVNIGSATAGTGDRALPSLATAPSAPNNLGLNNITQTSIHYDFIGTNDGGLPMLEWQIGYGTDPDTIMYYMSSDGSTDVINLAPGDTWYFWSRGRNGVGWGPWSSRISARTIAGARVKHNGVWKEAIPYVKHNGVWKIARPYVKHNGTWKKAG